MLTVEEAAVVLGILPGSVRDQIVKGRIMPRRFGGKGKRAGFLLIPRSEVERYEREYKGKRGRKRGGDSTKEQAR